MNWPLTSPKKVALIVLLVGVLASRYKNERVLTWHEIITDGHHGVPLWLVEDAQKVLGLIWKNVFESGHMEQAIQVILETFKEKDKRFRLEVIELAAGSGVAPAMWHKALCKRNINVHTILTDLKPNLRSWKKLSSEFPGVSYVNRPVDATHVALSASLANASDIVTVSDRVSPENQDLARIRMIHLALHHLEPPVVQGLFRDAMTNRESVFVGDLAPNVGGIFLNGLVAFQHSIIATPKLIQEQPLHLLVMPLMPLIIPMMLHDATVSVLRSYSPQQLMKLISKIIEPGLFPNYCFYTFPSVSYAKVIGLPPLMPFLNAPFLQFFWAYPSQDGECTPNDDIGKFVTQLDVNLF